MTTVRFADSSSGTYAEVIGWVDFTGTSFITSGNNKAFTNTLPDNSIISFTITNQNVSSNPALFAYATPMDNIYPFGNTGYTGIGGACGLMNANTGTLKAKISSISLKDANNNSITNYEIVVATATQIYTLYDTWTGVTNGGNWRLIDTIASVAGRSNASGVNGVGTTTITHLNASGTAFGGNLYSTTNATSINLDLSNACGFAIGIMLTKISLQNNIVNRVSKEDQFNLTLNGATTVTTTTYGNNYGVQNKISIINVVPFTSTMAQSIQIGSENTLQDYVINISASNTSTTRTNVSGVNSLSSSIVLVTGDNVLITVKNSITIPNITANKTVDRSICALNDTLYYTINLSNADSYTAGNIILIDTIPNNTMFVAGSLSINNISTLANPQNVSIPKLLPGGTSTINFSVKVTTLPQPTIITNNAAITFTGNSSAKAIVNSVSTTVNYVALSVNKKIDKNYSYLGDSIKYDIELSNSGNTSANNTVFLDTLPQNTVFVADSLKINGITQTGATYNQYINLGTIPIGGLTTVSFKVQVTTLPTTNSIKNSSVVTYNYTAHSTLPNGYLAGLNSNIVTTTINTALFNISNKGDKNYASIGDVLTYTIKLENIGNVTGNNVVILDTTPNDTAFVANSLTLNGIVKTGLNPNVGANLGTIPIGVNTVTFKVTVTTLPSTSAVLNSAKLSYSFTADPSLPNGVSSNINTNISSVTINYAKIQSIKTVDKTYTTSGEELTYYIRVINTGNVAAKNVTISDTLPVGLSLVNNSTYINNVISSDFLNVINLGTVNPVDVLTIIFKAKVEN